ncbi:MAG: flap endonuclease Xni [Acidiferrobacteraceae bacterium]|nr:flap endonuclease Xni [Acidiferrobacteraceae bacterium]
MLALLIDGPNLIRRIYAGISGYEEDGAYKSRVIESCLSSLSRALEVHQPSHALCAMDDREKSWRRNLFSKYKKNRKPIPSDLVEILGQIAQAFYDKGVLTIEVSEFEADDLIATISRKIEKAGGFVTILSTDKGFFQLISNSISVYDHFSHKFRGRDYVKQKFGVEPEQLVDLLSLVGDASANIIGARGIGLQTGAKLLAEYGSLDSLFDSIDEIEGMHRNRLRSSEKDVKLARQLLTLCTDVSVGNNLKEFRYPP